MTRIRQGEVVEGRYRLDRLLGEGGYGAVYAATHLEMGTPLALKLLHAHHSDSEETTARFRREARNTARLRHPHCVTVFDFGRSELAGQEVFFLAMELLDGETLADLLRRGPIEPHRAMVILDQILLALEAAHGLGLIHRDLKPDNVFLAKTGGLDQVKVLDFGIAKTLESEESASITASGTVIGTPAFMSPEQCRGVGIDARSDLYSLGCVAWAMLAGQPPFKRDSTLGYLLAHVQDPPGDIAHVAFLHEIPPQLRRFIATCLEKDPKDRYPTATAARQALSATGPLPAALMTARGAALPATPRRRHRSPLIATAVAALALGLGLFVLMTPDAEQAGPAAFASPPTEPVVVANETSSSPPPEAPTPPPETFEAPSSQASAQLEDSHPPTAPPHTTAPPEPIPTASPEPTPPPRLSPAELSALAESLCAPARRLSTRTARTVEAVARDTLTRDLAPHASQVELEVTQARAISLTLCTATPERECASCTVTPSSAPSPRPTPEQTAARERKSNAQPPPPSYDFAGDSIEADDSPGLSRTQVEAVVRPQLAKVVTAAAGYITRNGQVPTLRELHVIGAIPNPIDDWGHGLIFKVGEAIAGTVTVTVCSRGPESGSPHDDVCATGTARLATE